MRPEFGLCLPCRVRRCRDADTIEVSLPGSDRVWAIRLEGIDAPELRTAAGKAAKAWVEAVLDEAADDLAVWIPAPKDATRLLKGLLTFDRIVGDVWVGTERRLSRMLVDAGHAAPSPQVKPKSHGRSKGN